MSERRVIQPRIITPPPKKVEAVKEMPPDGAWGFDVAKGKDPEWIMLYGETGSGKTYRYLQLLDAIRIQDPEARFWILDTDVAVRKNISHFPELRDCGRVQAQFIQGDGVECWEALLPLTAALVGPAKGHGLVKPNDWIVVDRATWLWKTAPNYFVFKGTGQTVEKIEKDHADAGRKGSALLQYYASLINPGWYAWENDIIYNSGCNVIFICAEQDIQTEDSKVRTKDKHETVVAFNRVNMRPAIQKDTPFKFDTIMYISQPYARKYYVTTVRERRNRPEYERVQVPHLGFDYLVAKANYTPPSLSGSIQFDGAEEAEAEGEAEVEYVEEG